MPPILIPILSKPGTNTSQLDWWILIKIACFLFLIKSSIFSRLIYFILFLIKISFILRSSQIVIPRLFQLFLIIFCISSSLRFGKTYLQLFIAVLLARENLPKVLNKNDETFIEKFSGKIFYKK